MKTKTCSHCGNEFTTRDYRAKFCSRKCAAIAKTHKRVMRKCLACGQEFKVEPKHPDIRFCSQKCHGLSRQTLQITTCNGCGKEFLERYTGQGFCSTTCGAKYRQQLPIT